MVTNLLEGISEMDIRRFACCYLACDRSGIDWGKALSLFGGDAKLASFKTVTGKATTKALKNIGGESGATPKKAAANAGVKRKKAADEDDSGETPAKKKPGRKSKKTATPEADDDDADAAGVKEEDGEGEMV